MNKRKFASLLDYNVNIIVNDYTRITKNFKTSVDNILTTLRKIFQINSLIDTA